MSKAIITISFTVPPGHTPGDYAMLFGDLGSGTISYTAPLSQQKYPLFPDGAGFLGWHRLAWHNFPWHRGKSVNTPGWHYLPWHKFPFHHGAVTVTAKYTVTACGTYKFAFKCYDAAGNADAGTPEEVSVEVHIAPDAPTGLKKVSYDKATDILILEAA